MSADPITGKTIRWSYGEGAMKGQVFEHVFGSDGLVTYRAPGMEAHEAPIHYEVARLSDDVWAASYLSTNSWTLTTVINVRTREIVSFASNEKELHVQRGRLEP